MKTQTIAGARPVTESTHPEPVVRRGKNALVTVVAVVLAVVLAWVAVVLFVANYSIW